MWVFLICHVARTRGVLQQGTSSQVSRSVPQNRMHIRRGNLISPACGQGIINHHLALLPKNLAVVLKRFSEVMAKRLFNVHWVEWCPSGDIVHSHPFSFSVFPEVSRIITGFFSPVHPPHARIHCKCCPFQVLDGQMLRRSTHVFCSYPELSHMAR